MYGFLLIFIQFLTLLLLFLSGPVTPNNIFSFVLLPVGILLGLYALWYMRQSKIQIFPVVSKNAVLITQGPYQIIRHPMYTAVLLVTLSMVLNDFSITRMVIYVVLLINQLFKINYEEKLLANHFSEYADYKKTTAKLIPFIY